MIRLDKFVCDATGCSRSQAKRLIKSGCVTVNQTPVFNPDSKIKEGEDAVAADGRTLNLTGKVYYLLHKPAGVVSASRDAVSETVLDLLKGAPGRDLFPVGRLDKDTEGLLLLTNDGALAHRWRKLIWCARTDPSHKRCWIGLHRAWISETKLPQGRRRRLFFPPNPTDCI